MSFASAALRRPVATMAATMGLVLLGAVSLGRMPVSLLPDVALPVLTIRTIYPGAAPEEVSRFISEPIENQVGNTPGLLEMRSVARSGEATTTLRFNWGTDMSRTVLAVRERLDNARNQLPEAAQRPTLLTADPGERPIAVISLTGPGDLRAIARTAKDVHKRRLEQLSGVASVAVVGDPQDEIRVDVDPERARALGLTPDDVKTAIDNANATAQGGTIKRGQFRFSVRAMTELRDPMEIRDIPVGPTGRQMRLADIATVTPASADPRTIVHLDGNPAVGLVVYKDGGSNTVTVTRELERTLTDLRNEFPDVTVRLVAAQAKFVEDALSNLSQEIVIGGALAILLILLFLRDWRTALAIGLVIPLSVLIALTLLQMLDVTINILSLGGLALAVGLLVDNAIVVAEASGRLREQGLSPLDAARQAAEEVTGPLTAGTLTTLLVFGPIVFVQGLAAALFRDLSYSVVLSVGASLIVALTVMPVMLTWGRQRGQRSGAVLPAPGTASPSRIEGIYTFGRRMADRYERIVSWCLAQPRTVFALALAGAAVTVAITMQLPREILPQVDEGTAVAELRLPAGTSIEETVRQAARIEEAAQQLGSEGVYVRIGMATDEEVLSGSEPGSSGTAVFVIPVPEQMDAPRFADELRAAVPDLAQGALALDLAGQSEFGSLIGREGRTVRVEVSAPQRGDAARAADQVRVALQDLSGLADVRDAFAGTQPLVELTLQRDRIAQRGLTPQAIINGLKGSLGGVAATELRETDRRTPIQVRYAGIANEDLATALATPVQGMPLGEFVNVTETRAPIEVVRVNQRPVSVVEGVVEEGGTAKASATIRQTVERLDFGVPGIQWEVTGADQEQQRTTSQLLLVGLLAIALVFLVLAGEFASFTTPLLVMTTVPLAAAGGIVALWLTGQSLNAVSLIGLVVMIGMADNEAVVKLDAIRRFRADGHSVDESVRLGGRQRLRAITMTVTTTIAGVLPLVFGWGRGGELYRPLAAAIIGGSVTAIMVTFFLLPTAYAVVERRKARRAGVSA
ncbi:MAG: efflux RND transporter permease subunit [Gemmatimonadales bacterium]|nr:efflux RND transporter permease subunit [Gemmatimonadales bacterium]MDZ4389651.1 efflux RND transporter permease subunit [Gemmatimonadales bacterium]